MENSNRKFIILTAEDVNKKSVTKVSEIHEDQIHEIHKVVEYLKKDDRLDQHMNLLAETKLIFDLCLPTSYVKLYRVTEIRILAVIGEITLL